MKSHVLLMGRVLEDISIQCCTSTTRDLKTIAGRVEQEGSQFLTIQLPHLADLLEEGLREGRLNSNLPCGFAKKKGTHLPKLLFGVWAQVFDADTGVLLNEPNVDAVQSIRQVCNLFKKILYPCGDAREEAAFRQFVECDKQVGEFAKRKDFRERLPDFERMAFLVFYKRLLNPIDLAVWAGDVVPKHGPGATAERCYGNAKYDNRTWTTRLEKLFFAGDFLYPSWSHFLESENNGTGPTWLEPGEEWPVRVISVPKTQKTPRIIAIEPTHMQYVQQGLAELLVNGIEGDNLLSHFIGFSDQEYSRTLAREGSRTGDLASLDLSEASDRVSTLHVRALLSRTPTLSAGVSACRSQTAAVPGQGVIALNKFASMGSALTFPLEAMVFLIIALLGIEKERNTRFAKKDLQALIGKVRVYGDDIIVPTDCADSVSRELEAFGLKVNVNKSFWTGRFRESCGGEFFEGYDVGIVKVRRDLPTKRKHVREIISTVATRNLFYERGYWRTAEFLDELIKGLGIPFPRVGPESPALGRHSYLGYDVERECPYLQRPLVRAAVEYSKLPDSDVSGQGALLKYFLRRGDEPFNDPKHLERAGRPVSVNIKIRWCSSY